MPFNIGGTTLSSSMLTPDGVILPKNFKRVSSDMIDTVYNQNCTITSQGNDDTGGYSISYYFLLGGCGGTESGLYFTIKNTIPWSRILCKFTNNGTASCWTFNQNGYGGIAPNLASYNTALGDIIFTVDATNSFNNPSFTVQPGACDNASTNFMSGGYQTGDPKTFYMFMRRNNSNAAGVGHGRSCNGTGSEQNCTISEIYIL
jgi:hypothetical protein